MLIAKINYPNSQVTIHYNSECNLVREDISKGHRFIRIGSEKLEDELNNIERNIVFASKAGLNILVIVIDLENSDEEKEVFQNIKRLLGRRYRRIENAQMRVHCKNIKGLANELPEMKSKEKILLSDNMIKAHSNIRDRKEKIEAIIKTIKLHIKEINERYRRGPSLYFYQRILSLRRAEPRIGLFLSNEYHIEMLYAALVSWDMDSRNAKLKDFKAFKESINRCQAQFEELEKVNLGSKEYISSEVLKILSATYSKMELMESKGRLVSNSKCLHFLFPDLCMPMDGTNTLKYLFGNTYESRERYLDIIQFSFDIMIQPATYCTYLDDQWNQSIPKLIDNAIILLNEKSLKKLGD